MTIVNAMGDAAALPISERDALRLAIISACRVPEAVLLPTLIEAARPSDAVKQRSAALATRLVEALRSRRARSSGVDALMKEFSLSSQEGIALMCLAEALLRVPDKATADRLIRDKLAHGDWRAHLGHSPSLFVNAATWGLLVTGRLVATRSEEGLASALNRLLAKGGEPLIRKSMDLAMRMLGEQFVTGRDIDEALSRARPTMERGYRYSFDMLGEAAATAADADRYLAAYEEAIHAIGRAAKGVGVIEGNGISVKLSALHPRYVWSQPDRVRDELYPRIRRLCAIARDYDIGLNIDAEEADRLDLSLDILEALALDPELAGWTGLGFVVQAYQKRAWATLDWIIALARRSRRRLMIRLVKGAYWDAEIKRAQVDGLSDYPVWTRKVYTDVSYLACARKLLDARDAIFPQFATHNAHSLAAVHCIAGDPERDGDYEFQCLHGMGEPLYDALLADPALRRRVRIYAPVGSHETLLAYLVRRLLENGANSSFVNRIVDEAVPVEALVADPVAEAEALGGTPHPRIALPPALYGPGRRNSRGFDLSAEPVRRELGDAVAQAAARKFESGPILAIATAAKGRAEAVTNPADRRDRVGEVVEATEADVASALDAASASEWSRLPPEARAGRLERAADLMDAEAPALIALAVREAGKSWANAVAEVREAVDFLRYYACEARGFDNASHQPVGPVVCISPWNFPLAIFTGQVSAALAAGNVVLAKPAEQTPLIAAEAVRLLHRAGVPVDALQLLPGRGETVGAALVGDHRVRGVMFTGSTEVARIIQHSLAARGGDVRLIAETGGQNAMIVDSTALPEQVAADVIMSSFDSAGQRCSALRVLCLQEEIADHFLDMLRGSMRELRIGNTADVRNDVGPVIDEDARAGLEAHVETMRGRGHRVERLQLSDDCAHGSYVAPTLIEIDSLDAIEREQFGPILHVLRYRSGELDELVERINATGYGLTMGVHSRIDETIERVAARAHVGNLYVNRNIIGAVVGVQPFGGEGLSGTGPKAGGPLYLHRLLRRSPGPDLRRFPRPQVAPAFAALSDWLESGARTLLDGDTLAMLRDRADAYRAARLVSLELQLPGPTGEDNALRFVPRGTVAGVAETTAAWVHQLLAALACDNRVVLPDLKPTRALHEALPQPVRERMAIVDDLRDASWDVLLFDGEAQEADAWRRVLASRAGPIVPLLVADPLYDLIMLVHERTLSVNTAAAGGNASLMAMSG